MPPRYTVTIDETTFQILLLPGNQVSIGGTVRSFDFLKLSDGSFSFILDGKVFSVEEPSDGQRGRDILSVNEGGDAGSQMVIALNGFVYDVRVDSEHSLALKSLLAKHGDAGATHIVRAPMPGLISRMEVGIGDEVFPGKGLLVLEAMKMENEIRCLSSGKVQKIHVAKGKAVEKGEALVTIQKE